MVNLYKIEENIDLNIEDNVKYYNSPNKIIVKIEDKSKYKIGDYVYKGDIINHTFSSISGTIININDKLYLEIENDYKENRRVKPKKESIVNYDDLLHFLTDNMLDNIVAKLINKKNVTNLVISAIDEEKYNKRENKILKDNFREILDSINRVTKILNINKCYLACKNIDSIAIKRIKSISGMYPNIELKLVEDKYLIGYESFLCDFLSLNYDNSIVLNVSDIWMFNNCLNNKEERFQTLFSISGNVFEKGLIISAKNNTSLEEIINEFFEIDNCEYEVYLNGVISGKRIDNIMDVIITSSIKSVVLNRKKDISCESCINCGACIKICPFDIDVKKKYFKKQKDAKCINCGLCNFICPAELMLKEEVYDEKEKC